MDVIQLLKKDHRAVLQLFRQFERSAASAAEKRKVFRKVMKELSVHASMEEQVVYPALRGAGSRARRDADVLQALEEHHLVKLTLVELDKLSPKHERYDAKMQVLMDNVRHHIEEEERDLLPRLQRSMSPDELKRLGELCARAKKMAPTRPHPASPDQPPGNLLVGAVAGLVDRGRDAVRDLTH